MGGLSNVVFITELKIHKCVVRVNRILLQPWTSWTEQRTPNALAMHSASAFLHTLAEPSSSGSGGLFHSP
jgi:hypothetical protein